MGKNIVRFCIPSQSIQYFPHHGFFLYLLFLISLYSPTIAFGETIVAGVLADFPPQYSIDPQTGEPMGFAIDIMNDVAERLGVDVQYVLFDTWEDVQQALREQRIDIIPNMGITEDRKTWAEFTQPLEVFEICLFVRASTYDIRGVEELRGRYVSVVKTNIGGQLAQNLEGVVPVIHNSAPEALLNLLSGQSVPFLNPLEWLWPICFSDLLLYGKFALCNAVSLFIGGPVLFQVDKRFKIRTEEKRIRLSFMTNGRFRCHAVVMAGKNAGLIRQCHELLMKRVVFGSGLRTKIGSANLADKQSIAGKHSITDMDADRIGRVAWSMNNRHL
jgi:hypothetical protein